MYHNDLMTHTLRWVFGYCYLWNQQAKQFASGSQEFDDFVHRVHTKVWNHLHGRQALDASCSDLVCTMALDAKHLFREFIEAD